MSQKPLDLKKNRILIAGGSGFVGSALAKSLIAQGNEVIILSRSDDKGDVTWAQLEKEGLPACDAVVNLAGTNLMAKRWNERIKKSIFSSRIDATQRLVTAIHSSKSPPKVLVNASAIAYYRDDPDLLNNEYSGPGTGFLSEVCQQWEKAAHLLDSKKCRLAIVRIGVVIGSGGGALQRMLPPFKFGLGGRIGSGEQAFPWIHLDDLVNLITYAIENESVSGPLNGVAPQEITQKEFARALGTILRRPTWFPTPAALLKIALGERADVILENPRVTPERVCDLGFEFTYPTIDLALAQAVDK